MTAVATSSRFKNSDTVPAGVRSSANTNSTGASPPPKPTASNNRDRSAQTQQPGQRDRTDVVDNKLGRRRRRPEQHSSERTPHPTIALRQPTNTHNIHHPTRTDSTTLKTYVPAATPEATFGL